MGLDLYHYLAVLDPVDRDDWFEVGEFPAQEFEDLGFRRFVQRIQRWDAVHTVKFLPDATTVERERSRKNSVYFDSPTVSYLIGRPENCESELHELEAKFNLSSDEEAERTFNVDPSTESNCTHMRIYYRPTVIDGIFVQEAGYQRNGMSERFYAAYNSEFRLDQKAFSELESFAYDASDEDTCRNLRDNFAGQYQLGRSILYISS